MLLTRLRIPLLQTSRTACFQATTTRLYPCIRVTKKDLYENIYTIPNALTLARIAATPVIGHFVLQGQFAQATALLFVAGVSDVVDGYLARRYNMRSVLGSILDPAADKFLMTTMVVTLAMKSMLPRKSGAGVHPFLMQTEPKADVLVLSFSQVPLTILIIGRDVALSISAFYFRYKSLPPPKSFTRFWDFSIPSAEVKPTTLSKYNTLLQLILVGTTTIQPLLPFELGIGLVGLQLVVAGTTIGSGLSYVFGRGVKYL
ncbi:BZ3500_MvSof-1268-A1-R1_Chr6-3g08669 [Microbotryum saponariae]|uniref:BZ3500_MvSof-1268-A1-R1_Chr6-3g08669 protein n=1 Tax=Microbotryum saponariae TaxID=289078 RepID=A0A2X0LPA7_9BASI|nr:BZ3500_MvSof-1268-A1-R1_Chr6-3g08669 [Microbotryum saponariae]SDA07270.1 BZ3501_MvSof-1269-A2-R1_Chr6-2g08372 [Microbotryum saponariae]